MFKNFFELFLSSFISPPTCFFCRTPIVRVETLCSDCLARIRPVVSLSLPIGSSIKMSVFAAGAYADPLKKMVLAKGWSDRTTTRHLGKLIWQLSAIKTISFDCIVPVPLHWTRYARRGFNQAEEIASVISLLSGKPILSIVRRGRRTSFQSLLSINERSKNVRGAFQLCNTKSDLKEKRVLIIDDVLTSGATMSAVAKELQKLQPGKIIGLVACRVT